MSFKTLLLEAAEYNDEFELAKAILRGQIPGVSAKKFFGEDRISVVENAIKDKSSSMATSSLKQVIRFKENFKKQDQNAATALILKKAGYWSKITKDIDPYISYFNNKNKKEAKENEEIKNLFKKFEETSAENSFNKEFENKINDFFADKAVVKSSDEIEIIYPEDDKGWSISSPKTFAAAKMLACMNNRKAKWCTSAKANMYSAYTKNNNKLFIIRNKKENKMFQMDWSTGDNDWFAPNFKDEEDSSVKITVAEKEIPDYILNKLKNKDGVSVLGFMKKTKEEENKKETKNKEKNIEQDWKLYTVYTNNKVNELSKIYNIKLFKFINTYKENSIEDILKNSEMKKDSEKFYFLTNGKKFFIVEGNNKTSTIFEIVKDKKIKRQHTTFLNLDLPLKIKEKLFPIKIEKNVDLEEIEKNKVYILKNNNAILEFLPVKLYDEILNGNRTLRRFFRGKQKTLLFIIGRAKFFFSLMNYQVGFSVSKETTKQKFYPISLSFISNPDSFLSNDMEYIKFYIKKNFKDLYNKLNIKENKKQEIDFAKIKKNKYNIYNLDGKKIVYFPSYNSFFYFLIDKKINIDNYRYFDNLNYSFYSFMIFENNELKKITEEEFNKLKAKYDFLKGKALKYFTVGKRVFEARVNNKETGDDKKILQRIKNRNRGLEESLLLKQLKFIDEELRNNNIHKI